MSAALKATATIHHLPTASEKQLSIEGFMELPEPLTPADCDLTAFPYFPFEVVRFRGSEFATTVDPAAGFCAIMLWSASWHQVPAASLPDNDVALANLAGFGRYVSEWLKVKEQALYGFVKCSDGRLYHKHLAILANEAWVLSRKRKNAAAIRWEKERIAKEQQDYSTSDASALQVHCTTNATEREQRGEEREEDNNPLYPPCSETEEPKPKATGKQSPKNDGRTKLTHAWIEENTEAMKQVYFGKMRESELKATESRWSFIRNDFTEHWINSATNAEKFKKTNWLSTWENQVEKQINYNKLKWKAEEERRPANGASHAQQGKHALSENFLTTGRGVDWDYIQSQWAEQGGV